MQTKNSRKSLELQNRFRTVTVSQSFSNIQKKHQGTAGKTCKQWKVAHAHELSALALDSAALHGPSVPLLRNGTQRCNRIVLRSSCRPPAAARSHHTASSMCCCHNAVAGTAFDSPSVRMSMFILVPLPCEPHQMKLSTACCGVKSFNMGGGGHYDYPKHVWSPAGGWMWERAPRAWKRNTGWLAFHLLAFRRFFIKFMYLLLGVAVAILGVCLVSTFNVSRSLEVRHFCFHR